MPGADSCTATKESAWASLLDHLVRAQQQRGGQLNADRLRGLEIDHQLVTGERIMMHPRRGHGPAAQ